MLILFNLWLAFLSAAVWSPRRPISAALRYQLIATATYLPWAISGFASGSPSLGSLRSAVAPPPPPAREGFLIRVGWFILSLPLLALRKNSGETLTKPRRARDDQPAAATFSAATRRRLRGGGRSPARARSPIRHLCGKRFGKGGWFSRSHAAQRNAAVRLPGDRTLPTRNLRRVQIVLGVGITRYLYILGHAPA